MAKNNRKNYKHSEETKRKISESHKGKKYSKELKEKLSKIHKNIENPSTFKKGHKAWNKELTKKDPRVKKYSDKRIGMKHSEKAKKKIGNRKYPNGEEHPNWQGGLTPINFKIRNSKEYALWRKAVFERDGYKCIWCGSDKKIQADHIKSFALFPELRFAIDNGRTLCEDCHKKTSTWGGRTNVKKRQACICTT